MKRVLCLLLCMLLVLPLAVAETADTLPKKFARQLTGGNGVRGYISITASGVADWLSYLLPFTASDIQIRAIGEKQGEMSDAIDDDDDWQVKLYAENSADEAVGTTWIYGDPNGVYFQSEMLPGTVLTVPVEKTHLLYQIFKGEWSDLFFAFDPMDMKAPGANGNASAYSAVAELLGIPAEEWETKWLPVLENYFLQLDLWLTSYGDPSYVEGEEVGDLKMTATYTIPADAIKAEAKYLIAQMMYDHDLQNLLLPYVTMEQRVTYLNPTMIYFYDACIDALALEGDVVLSREMSAMGEVVSTTIALPVPALPQTLTDPANELAKVLFELPNEDIFADVNRVVMQQNGANKAVTLSGAKRTITIEAVESTVDEYKTAWNGTVKIIPNAGVEEDALSAAFSCAAGKKIWQDEKYLDHETTELAIAFDPDLENLDEDNPFRNSYIAFKPVSLSAKVDYRNNPNQANSAVQINIDIDAELPEASVQAEAVLRITNQMQMDNLASTGAEDVTKLDDARKEELLDKFVLGAVETMANLSGVALEEAKAEKEAPQPEATVVPPAAEPTND